MKKNFIEQSYLSVGLLDTVHPNVTKSLIDQILSAARDAGIRPLSRALVLDAGAGDAHFSIAISPYVKKVVAVEPDDTQYALALKKKKRNKSHIELHKKLIEQFRTKDRFDIILSLTVFEHMPDAQSSFDAIFRLLKPGGIIYLTVPNKLWPYEYHYRLWFLSYLPLRLANLYVRAAGRGVSFEDSAYMPTYFSLIRFFRQYPCSLRFIVPSSNAAYLGWGLPTSSLYSIIQRVGLFLLRTVPIFWVFSKTFILVIKKDAPNKDA